MAPAVLELSRENAGQINLLRCVLELYTLLQDACPEDILTAIEAARNCYPDDPEIAYWAGCLFQKMGRDAEAEELFEAAQTTTNGIILFNLKEMGFPRTAEGEE